VTPENSKLLNLDYKFEFKKYAPFGQLGNPGKRIDFDSFYVILSSAVEHVSKFSDILILT
jgi:hypothetical protein